MGSLRAAKARTVALRRRRGAVGGATLAAALLVAPLVTAACAGAVKHADAASAMTQQAGREDVILFPVLGPGEGGWCLSKVNDAGVDCPTYALPSRAGPFAGPIIVESWSGFSGGSGPPVDTALILTTSEVAAVSLEGGAPIRTRAQASLPDHMRSALVNLIGGTGKHVFGVEEPPPLPRVRFTALNARGERLREAHTLGPPLVRRSPTRTWGGYRGAARGVCQVRTKRLAGLVPEGTLEMISVVPQRDVRGREFVDCIQKRYSLNGWPIRADLLIDAAHPGAPPAPLPAMRPLRGFAREVIVQGPGATGQTMARRVPGGWLVVTKGSSPKQRLALLEHLEVSSMP